MIKLLMSILLILCSFGLPSPQALAKGKSSKRAVKNDFSNLVYEGVWFSRLSEKQQIVYLQTIEKLTMQLAGRRVAGLDRSFLKFMIPNLDADAGQRINNGFIFYGSNDGPDYDVFLASLNVLGGPLDPACSGRDQVCAPYMGMVCSGSDPGKLACSPDSTPTCASRGTLECLRSSLASCGMNAQGQKIAGSFTSSDYCNSLDQLMQRGTQNVAGFCSSGSRPAANYCRQALARLQGADTPPAPSMSPPPTGADCEQMVRELSTARDSHARRRRGAGPKPVNNSFWRNMTGFAQQACGHSTVTSNRAGNGTMDIIGTCMVQDMAPPGGGNIQRARVNTYKREEDAAGFGRCIETKITNSMNKDARIAALRETTPLPTEEIDRIERSIADPIRLTANRTGICTIQENQAITDGLGNPVNNELEFSQLESLSQKIRSSTDLSPAEENKFRAATGLTSDNFRAAFCNSTNLPAFKTALRRALTAEPQITGTDSISNLFLGQSRVARYKMGRCLSNLQAVSGDEGNGCRMYIVNNSNTIRCATTQNPILAVNTETRQCMLVTGFDRRVTAEDDDGQATGYEVRLKVRTPGSSSEMTIESERIFQGSHQLQEYRCAGDRSVDALAPGECPAYRRATDDDPAHEGEAEAAI